MIPRSNILEWRDNAPWLFDEMIEQDLILSRIIIEIFSDPILASGFAFRGGTALQKIYFKEQIRYSEDIDLVQVNPGPIGSLVNRMREKIDPWLGLPKSAQNSGRFCLYYKFKSETEPAVDMRIKIEINTREHFTTLGYVKKHFSVQNNWFNGETYINTYTLEELLSTKLRALYQRKKGRDLLDIGYCLEYLKPSIRNILESFQGYAEQVGANPTRAQFEKNIYEKLRDPKFLLDIQPLLPANSPYATKMRQFANLVHSELVSVISGQSWRLLPENFFEEVV